MGPNGTPSGALTYAGTVNMAASSIGGAISQPSGLSERFSPASPVSGNPAVPESSLESYQNDRF
jgi:hypothetical protein